MGKFLSISLKQKFTPKTLGCHGLMTTHYFFVSGIYHGTNLYFRDDIGKLQAYL